MAMHFARPNGNHGMVHEPVDSCRRHGLIGEDLAPCAQWLIGSDQHRASLVAADDQLEQHTWSAVLKPTRGNQRKCLIVAPQQLDSASKGQQKSLRALVIDTITASLPAAALKLNCCRIGGAQNDCGERIFAINYLQLRP
jgi:hypothetical protein